MTTLPGARLEPGLLRTRRGSVATFDDAGGFGTVDDDAGASHFFHCSTIADGSRTIAVGTAVRYLLTLGNGGAFEARDVVPVA